MKPFVSVGAGLLYQNNNTDDGTFLMWEYQAIISTGLSKLL